MPIILLCGTPSSGKTYHAKIMKDYFEKQQNKKVYLINEEELLLQKQEAYKGSCFYLDYAQEKITRAQLKSNVEKNLNQEDIVILDSLNYIKGFRYEIFCLARTAKTHHCVVWCNTNEKACKEYAEQNQNKLTEQQFEDFTKRFETPRLNQRWDTPLYELRYLEEAPLEKIAETILFKDKKSKDPVSTALVIILFKEHNLNSNFLSELDNKVQQVNEDILKVQNENITNFIKYGKIQLELQRNFNVIELKKFKLEFLKICKQNPPKTVNMIQESYASYIQAASQRL